MKSSILKDVIDVCVDAVKCFLISGISDAQNKFNGTIKQ